jgi:hypothetical protein
MFGNFFSAAAARILELSALQLPHWFIVAGFVLVIAGTIGAFLSGRRASVREQPERRVGGGRAIPRRRTSDALPPSSFTD